MEGLSKCVLQMTMEFVGIPYADCFTVEIRWVARSIAPSRLKIDVGATVVFQKQTFLRSKISSATIEETRPTHESLLRAVKSVLNSNFEGKRSKKSIVVSQEAATKDSTAVFDRSSTTWNATNLYAAVAGIMIVLVYLFLTSDVFSTKRHDKLLCHEQLHDMQQQIEAVAAELRQLKESLGEIKDLVVATNKR